MMQSESRAAIRTTTGTDRKVQRVAEELVDMGKNMLHESARRLAQMGRLVLDGYQAWYTKSLTLVEEVLPQRADEFKDLYGPTHPRPTKLTLGSYRVRDYLVDRWPEASPGKDDSEATLEAENAVFQLVRQQVLIMESVAETLPDLLTSLRGSIQRSLFHSELDAARALADNGHPRAAGALAGVVLETWLKSVAQKKNVDVSGPRPSINAYNQALMKAGVFDSIVRGKVEHLGRLRNLCVHKGQRDPTVEEVNELLEGVGGLAERAPPASVAEARPR